MSEVNGEVCEEEYVLGTSRVIEAHILWGRDPPAVSEWLTHITLGRTSACSKMYRCKRGLGDIISAGSEV